MNKNISIIKIKDFLDAERVLEILESRRIPIINTCACIHSIYNEYFHSKSRPVCNNGHVILVPERYYELALEITRSVEEDLPILY